MPTLWDLAASVLTGRVSVAQPRGDTISGVVGGGMVGDMVEEDVAVGGDVVVVVEGGVVVDVVAWGVAGMVVQGEVAGADVDLGVGKKHTRTCVVHILDMQFF